MEVGSPALSPNRKIPGSVPTVVQWIAFVFGGFIEKPGQSRNESPFVSGQRLNPQFVIWLWVKTNGTIWGRCTAHFSLFSENWTGSTGF